MTDPNRPDAEDLGSNLPETPDLWAQKATKEGANRTPTQRQDRWEREVLEKLVLATVREQRAARRWRIFWRLLWLGIVGALIWNFSAREIGGGVRSSPHTAGVDIKGEIAAQAPSRPSASQRTWTTCVTRCAPYWKASNRAPSACKATPSPSPAPMTATR